jgi:5-methylcytosine-specific restriction endonuclease McrA
VKRGGPLPRKTPLAQGKPLARNSAPIERVPMARTSAKPYPPCDADAACTHLATRKSGGPCAFHKERPVRAVSGPAKPGVTQDTRMVVLARCGGRCEACGREFRDVTPDLHHRQSRARGDHSPANLVALHPKCHTIAPEAVHQRPAWARERGLIVLSTEDPAATPLALPSGRRVWLDPVNPFYLPEAA